MKITYFVPDTRKEGGEYITQIGTVRKVDGNRRIIVFDDREICIEDIISIDGIESDLN